MLPENLGANGQLEMPTNKYKFSSKTTTKPYDNVIYTDGSFKSDRSGWGYKVKHGGKAVCKDRGAYRVTISSLTMEVESVTNAIQWIASPRDTQITHAIILSISLNLQQKEESGMDCLVWHTVIHSLRLWIYCPGHAVVSGN